MAVTLSTLKHVAAGNSHRVVGSITGPASYSTGGELLTAQQIANLTANTAGDRSTTSLASILTFDSDVEPANFRRLVLDRTNLKVKFVSGGTEVANATNLSAVTINFSALNRIANG